MTPCETPTMAGKPYRPSNGSEGMRFEAEWCKKCAKFVEVVEDPPGDPPCPIHMAALIYTVGEPEYPSEWTHDDRGRPMCTAFDPRKDGQEQPPVGDHPSQGRFFKN